MRKGKNSFRRAAAVVCALAMCASAMPSAAFAEESAVTTQEPATVTSEVSEEDPQKQEETTDNTEATDPVDSTESTDTTEKTDVTDSTDTTESTDATESAEQTDDIDAADSTENTESDVNSDEEAGEKAEETTENDAQPTEETEESADSDSVALLSLEDEGTPAETDGENQVGKTVEIDSNKDLVDAILHQADDQTWVFTKAGTYNVFNAANYQDDKTGLSSTNQMYGGYVPAEELLEGHSDAEYIFPIYVDNLTITKDASVTDDVTLTSTATPSETIGGMGNYQNFITVFGNNVTIEGVNLKSNTNEYYGTCNKVVELINAQSLTLKDVNVISLRNSEGKKFGGSIYFNTENAGESKIENVTMDAWISAGTVKSGKIAIDGLTQDFSNSEYAGYQYEGSYGWNPCVKGSDDVITTQNYTIIVDDKTDLSNQVFNENLRAGTTIQLKPGNYNLTPNNTHEVSGQTGWYMAIDKSVTVQGIDNSGNVITDATQAKASIYSTNYAANGAWSAQNLITVFADDVTLEGLVIMNKVEPNKAIEVVGDESAAMDFTVRNCKFAPIAKSLLKDGAVTDGNGNTVYTWDEYKQYGASLYFSAKGKCEINATVENNYFDHSGISLGATTKGVYTISGNTFDGAKNWNNDPDYYYSTIGYQGKWLYPDPDCTTLGDAVVNVTGNTFNDAGEINFSQVTTGDEVVDLSGNTGLDTGKVSGPVKVDGQMIIDSEGALKVAIAAAQPGDTIKLAGDVVLSDTLILDKDITIDGDGHTISTTAIKTALEAVNGESNKYSAIVAATNNANVVLKNLTVKGDPAAASQDANLTHYNRYIGVAAVNANLTMENCKVLDITYTGDLQGMQNGFGVYAVSDSAKTLTLNNTEISNFNKAAVVVRDKVDLVMDGCTITGFGEQAIIAQNGVQFAGNASIKNTQISGLVYNADNEWTHASTAIYNLGTDDKKATLENVVCNNVDTSFYAAGGNTTIYSGKYVHVGEDNAAVSGDDAAKIAVLGGTFDSNPSAYVPAGYECTVGGDGTFTVKTASQAPSEDKKEETTSTQGSSSNTQSTTQSGSNITYYTCPACGYHDWTAGADGYKCNHCGYVESVKQLSGYGNVKGVYEPKTSAAAAQSVSSSAIPQTGDVMPIGLMGGVTVIAAAAFVALFVLRKRQNND